MDLEQEITEMSPRERLKELEKSGKYVFHGSPQKLTKLEPRQAYNKNSETGKMEPDGDPAIAATKYADIAIFRSLINSQHDKVLGRNHSSEFGVEEGGPYFKSLQHSVDNAKDSNTVGYVHVFPIEKFSNYREYEERAYETQIPIMIFEVHGSDLPENIEIIDK